MTKFVKFCKKYIWEEFVLIGVGISLQELSKFLPTWLEAWISQLGLLIAIFSIVTLGVGLIAQGREDKQDKTNSK
jgi:hypothetical protein